MHLAAALVSLLFGLMIPSLLNGQTFTNNLVGIAFTIAAIALAHGPARDTLASKASRLVGRTVLIVSVLLTVLLVAQLRTAYRFQAEFNRRVRALRQPKQNEKPLIAWGANPSMMILARFAVGPIRGDSPV